MSLKATKDVKSGTFKVIQRKTLQLTDLVANSNKYYTAELREYSDGQWCIYTVYGRTGASKTEDYRYSDAAKCDAEFARLLKNKSKKGYELVETEDTVDTSPTTKQIPKVNVNKGVVGPVEAFVNYIYGFSRNFVSKTVDMPIGKLSVAQIEKAQGLLKTIESKMLTKRPKITDEVISLHNEYYKAVPQRLGHRIQIQDVLLHTDKEIATQEELLQNIKDMVVVKSSDTDFYKRYEGLNATIEVPTKSEIDRIKHYVLNSRSRHHGIESIEIKDILAINRPQDNAAYNKELASICEAEVFHGTKNANLLGICSRGLMLPGQHSASITGAMYGPGVYGAIHSTKSMQYCGPGYDNRHGERDEDQFMFVMQFAMGNAQSGTDWRNNRKLLTGKDSTWAKVNEDRLLHDELIVYTVPQVRMTHIVRFQTKGRFW